MTNPNQTKVVLINAPMEVVSERHYARRNAPRLGMAYLSSYLKKEGINVKNIDAKFEGLSQDETVRKVISLSPQFIGFTAMTPEIADTAKLAKQIKSCLPHVKIIVGGPHATAIPEETMEEFPVFDYAVIGEGEITLAELINRVEQNNTVEGVAGVAFRTKNKIYINAARDYIENLDDLPLPDWGAFPRATEVYPIISSRGCPFKCIFCMQVSGHKVRRRSPSKVINEIQYVIDNCHPKRIGFSDETFGLNKKWTHELLDMMIARFMHKKVYFTATTRVDMSDFEIFKKMKKAGFTFVAFGIESGNKYILQQSKKGITLEQAQNAVKLAKKAGLRVGSFFILGFPNETKETMRDTIDFASTLPIDFAACGIMVPYPGTEVAKMVKNGEGNYRIISTNWNDFNKQFGNALELKNISRKELENFQLKFYLNFFLRHFTFSKLILLIKLYGFVSIIFGLVLFLRGAITGKRA